MRAAVVLGIAGCLVVAACGDARDAAPPPRPERREPARARVAPEEAPREAPPEAAPEAARPAEPVPPSGLDTTRVAGESVERAIEPVEGGALVVASVARGRTRYVLYRYDGAAVARARIAAGPEGDLRLEAIDDAVEDCAGGDNYQTFSCATEAAPDPYLAAAAICAARGWGVAVVEQRGSRHVRIARRLLVALSCAESSVLDVSAALRMRDVDADGREELVVTIPVELVRRDAGMTGADSGVVAYVLDTGLRTQLRVTSHLESSNADVSGTTTTCRGRWRFVDVDRDGHDDIHVDARCTHAYQDEESGTGSRSRTTDVRDCLYDVGQDAWACGPHPIATWLFDGDLDGIMGESVEDAAAAMGGNLGVGLPAILVRAREANPEEESSAPDPP